MFVRAALLFAGIPLGLVITIMVLTVLLEHVGKITKD